MSTIAPSPVDNADNVDEALREALRRGAPGLFGGPAGIAEIRRTPFKLSTSYDTQVLDVRMADGRERKVFLKDFGHSARPKDDPRERREREWYVYRELLPGAGIGTPTYYGAVWDESRGRHWLLLEYVEGTPVGYCELGAWAPAAAGLGRMHGRFAGQVDRLNACELLVRHFADFFRSKAESAIHGVGQVAPHLVERAEPLVRLYRSLIPVMLDQPTTLLHGGCRPTNILIRVAPDPSRVCILDFEEAGVGPALLDLAYLLDGVEQPTLGPLLEAYRREALGQGLALPRADGLRHMEYAVNVFRLHVVVNSLSHAVVKRFSEKGVGKLLDLGERIGGSLAARRSRQPSVVVRMVNGAKVARASDGGDADLRLALGRLLEHERERPVVVSSVAREPSAFATVAAAEVLSVELADGTRTRLFLKHLGEEQADHPDKQRRDREVCIYEELFAGQADLPVAGYYGSRWNDQTQRREVFLEFVDDWNLTCHHLEHWFTAARRLAHLQARFAARAEQLRACDFLLKLDGQYLRDWAGRALGAVRRESVGLAGELAGVVERYGDVAEMIARQPQTLVHNDLAPKNVLADRSADPPRICFVDWEMAGVGCGVLDVVMLKHGLGQADDRAMCAAYCEELEGAGVLPADPRERDALFAACELHQTLFRLAHVRAWGLPLATAARWVGEAGELLDRARGATPRLGTLSTRGARV